MFSFLFVVSTFQLFSCLIVLFLCVVGHETELLSGGNTSDLTYNSEIKLVLLTDQVPPFPPKTFAIPLMTSHNTSRPRDYCSLLIGRFGQADLHLPFYTPNYTTERDLSLGIVSRNTNKGFVPENMLLFCGVLFALNTNNTAERWLIIICVIIYQINKIIMMK